MPLEPADRRVLEVGFSMAISVGLSLAWLDLTAAVGSAPQAILAYPDHVHHLTSDHGEELYDLDLDPGEQHSIHGQRPQVLAQARKALDSAATESRELRASLGIGKDNEHILDVETRERLEALGYHPSE